MPEGSEEAQAIGRRLGYLRRRRACDLDKDLSFAEIARDVGISDVSYSRYEAGKRTPKPKTLKALADYFGTTPKWLRYGNDDEPAADEAETIPVEAFEEMPATPRVPKRNARRA